MDGQDIAKIYAEVRALEAEPDKAKRWPPHDCTVAERLAYLKPLLPVSEPQKPDAAEDTVNTSTPTHTTPVHSGIDYATKPALVEKAAGLEAGLKIEKDERVPNPFRFARQPVRPAPAIPTEGSRPAKGWFGGNVPMSPEAAAAKGLNDDEPALPEPKEAK